MSASLQDFVRDYYGTLLSKSEDLKTNACCAAGAPPAWIAQALQHVHEDVSARFYGCGFPFPHAVGGAKVLDLGCGTGRDVYVLSQLVGTCGHVTGVDMTEEQLEVARRTQAWHAERFGHASSNVTFVSGFIEDLEGAGVREAELDVVISNCVVNLSPRKDLVLEQAYRALKPGGELYFSDVFVDRRLPEDLATDPVLYAECLGGALYENDFVQMAKAAGFDDPRVMSRSAITIQNAEVEQKVGAASFESVTYRLFKLEGLDAQCEDYGQLATYKGGVPGAERVFWLDDHHAFEMGRPERVCANTAAMLSQTRLGKYFEVVGERTTHYGEFPCGPTMAAAQYGSQDNTQGAGALVSSGGGCC